MDRISCVEDDTKRNPGYFPGYLTVKLKDGRTLVKDQRWEIGTEQNPLNVQAVRRKFTDNLSALYSDQQIQTLLDQVKQLRVLPGAEGLIAALHR